MHRILFILTFFLMPFLCAQKKIEEIRILNLLPYIVHPPLVEPCLPGEFVLGKQEDDPYFSKGYYWGKESALASYFEDPTTLKGCLIRAQISNNVRQLGSDRFSNDTHTQELTAAGFTEIQVVKGRWGIFPYRERLAKGPRGKRYYQMWVGLNTPEGATLYFQFIYPDYLNEPTQTQKSIWANFVKKTALLSMEDLLVVRGESLSPVQEEEEIFSFIVEKRKSDQKLLVQIAPKKELSGTFSVVAVKELNLLSQEGIRSPTIEVEVLVALEEGEEVLETFFVPYQLVDVFSFHAGMLGRSSLEEINNSLVFYSVHDNF